MSSRNSFVTVPKKNFPDKSAKTFVSKIAGEKFEGFVVRYEDRYYAYQNLCRHLPITLDLNDAQFFSHDKKSLQCHMHGALYNIQTGKCYEGPCEGDSLRALDLVEEEDRLVIKLPESASDPR